MSKIHMLLFFLLSFCSSLESPTNCLDGSCPTSQLGSDLWFPSLGEIHGTLKLLEPVIQKQAHFIQDYSHFLNGMHLAIQKRQKLFRPDGRPVVSDSLPAAEPYFWLRRQAEVGRLVQNSNALVSHLKASAAQYRHAIGRYLKQVYNIQTDEPTDCGATDSECNRSAFRDAVQALLRLQDTYLMDPTTLVDWSGGGNITLRDVDIYSIAKEAYQMGKYSDCVQWMNVTYNHMSKSSTIRPFEVLDYMSFCQYKVGNIEAAIELGEKVLELDPANDRVVKNLDYYRNMLAKGEKGEVPEEEEDQYMKIYKRLCRALLEDNPHDFDAVTLESAKPTPAPAPHRIWKLADPLSKQCKYLDREVSGWESYVVGVEVVSIYPPAIVFHNFISDYEIEELKQVALANGLRRSLVISPSTGNLITADYRSSQSVFLNKNSYDIVTLLDTRTERLTQLSVELADELQIAYYAPGGHYEPHFDFSSNSLSINTDKGGNRIGTLLMYLNNVDVGGATAFLYARPPMAIKPRKGSALFWYNLAGPHAPYVNHTETGDTAGKAGSFSVLHQLNTERLAGSNWYDQPNHYGENGISETRHAACPVRFGHKWVANKWIREFPQNSHRYFP